MAKKKQKKEKEKFEYSNEVIGVLFVLLAIIGMLGYGVAGNFIRSFAVFLMGVAYFPLLVLFLILGLYLIVKRKGPKFISRLSIGLYLIVMAILTWIHMGYLNNFSGTEIVSETFKNVMLAFKSADMIQHCGGGMLGSILVYAFDWAFADGIIIVIITLILLGLIFVFNTSILNMFSKVRLPKVSKENKVDKEVSVSVSTGDNDDNAKVVEETDKKMVVSSIDELKIKKNDVNESVKEEVKVDVDIPIKKVNDAEIIKEEVVINMKPNSLNEVSGYYLIFKE